MTIEEALSQGYTHFVNRGYNGGVDEHGQIVPVVYSLSSKEDIRRAIRDEKDRYFHLVKENDKTRLSIEEEKLALTIKHSLIDSRIPTFYKDKAKAREQMLNGCERLIKALLFKINENLQKTECLVRHNVYVDLLDSRNSVMNYLR